MWARKKFLFEQFMQFLIALKQAIESKTPAAVQDVMSHDKKTQQHKHFPFGFHCTQIAVRIFPISFSNNNTRFLALCRLIACSLAFCFVLFWNSHASIVVELSCIEEKPETVDSTFLLFLLFFGLFSKKSIIWSFHFYCFNDLLWEKGNAWFFFWCRQFWLSHSIVFLSMPRR